MTDTHHPHAPAPVTPRAARRATRRDERLARTRLRRELASFTTSADQHDLDAILARHSDAETAEVRGLLTTLDPSPALWHMTPAPAGRSEFPALSLAVG